MESFHKMTHGLPQRIRFSTYLTPLDVLYEWEVDGYRLPYETICRFHDELPYILKFYEVECRLFWDSSSRELGYRLYVPELASFQIATIYLSHKTQQPVEVRVKYQQLLTDKEILLENLMQALANV